MNKNALAHDSLSLIGAVIVLVCSSSSIAANVVSTLNSGGGRSSSVKYTLDTSIGTLGGVSAGGPVRSIGGGFPSQLTEVTNLVAKASPSSVNEDGTSQLNGVASFDDATTTVLSGSDITWSILSGPIAFISASGVATPAAVYTDAVAVIRGSYGKTNSVSLTVLNNDPDNYGIYAGDGIPDSWQAQYFGLNNPNAAPTADADGTGQNNLFKYIAGLDPTNPASIFVLKIASVPAQPTQRTLTWTPLASARTYMPEFRTNLVSGAYTNLTTYTGPTTNSTQVAVTDTNATQASKFYRVRITYP